MFFGKLKPLESLVKLWGPILLFLTGFFWSWGANISVEITQYQAHHAKPFTFWGAYHRFNRFILALVESELPWVSQIVQGCLAALFFLPIAFIGQTWSYWLYLPLGGLVFILFQRLINLRIPK